MTGNITLGNITGGRYKKTYTVQDDLLSSIILGLLDEKRRHINGRIHINMDKLVFFRVMLTYLYRSSLQPLTNK